MDFHFTCVEDNYAEKVFRKATGVNNNNNNNTK